MMTLYERQVMTIIVNETERKLIKLCEKVRSLIDNEYRENGNPEPENIAKPEVVNEPPKVREKPVIKKVKPMANTGARSVDYDEKAFPPQLLAWKRVHEVNIGRMITKAEFASLLGVHPNDLSSFLSGYKKFGSETLGKMSKAFGVTPQDFLAGPQEKPAKPEMIRPEVIASVKVEEKPEPLQATKAKKDEDDKTDPLVVAFCRKCHDREDGDNCRSCSVHRSLVRAKQQETPGEITHNSKQTVCISCTGRKQGVCGLCKLNALWAAKEMFDLGQTIEDATDLALSDCSANRIAHENKNRKPEVVNG